MIRALALAAVVFSVSAQAQHDHAAMSSGAPSSLTAQQVEQLLAGEGMGLAKPAELHHYPGPKHVLELAGELQLSEDQRHRVEAVRQQMLGAAKTLGARIVEAERALDAAFASGRLDAGGLEDQTAAIGQLQGQLRATHLRAHLETRPLLSAEQIARYDQLRGYPAAK